MTFSDDLKKFALKCEVKTTEDFVEITSEVQRSLVEGAPELTGSAGQPVDTGFLRSSFVSRFLSPLSWIIESDAPYAPSIEDGVSYSHGGSPMRLRSPVGGFHSAKLTVAGFQRIVDSVVRRNARA